MQHSLRTIALADFDVYLTTLAKNAKVTMLVSIPPGFSTNADPKQGINTYRANLVKKGTIEFNEPGMIPFVRTKGESPQASRAARAGDYTLTGQDDQNEFVCILSKSSNPRHYDYGSVVIAPGASVTIEQNPTGERNIFLIEGTVSIDGHERSGFKHSQLGQPKDYLITNIGEEEVFIVYMWEIGVEGAQDLVRLHYPDQTSDFSVMGE